MARGMLFACTTFQRSVSPAREAERPATPRTELDDSAVVNLKDDFGRNRAGVHFDCGFSTLVGSGGRTILFDAGTNGETFCKNVAALGVALKTVDVAILSHNHPDHTAGFRHLLEVNPSVRTFLLEHPLLGGC